MKKKLSIILAVFMIIGAVGIVPAFSTNTIADEKSKTADSEKSDVPEKPYFIKDTAKVAAVYASKEQGLDQKAKEGTEQPQEPPADAGDDLEATVFDTVVIFYDDNTFDHYAEDMKVRGFQLFGTGKYSFKDGGDFSGDKGTLVLERNKKFSVKEGKLEDYSATQEFELGSFGMTKLYGPEDKKEVEFIAGDTCWLVTRDKNDVVSHLDGIVIYFTDKSFEQFAFRDKEISLYGNGTYEFDKDGDFHAYPFEEKSGTITMTWDKATETFQNKKVTFDIKSMGLTPMYEQKDENQPEPSKEAEPTPKPTEKPTATPTPTPSPTPVSAPNITADPTPETVEEGGSCLYIAKADNEESIIWHFVSPEGNVDVAYNAIASYFPDLKVEGGESENLTLSNIPLDFNGWKAYCEFTNAGGKTKSSSVATTVNAKPTPTPTEEPTPEPTEEPEPEPTDEPSPGHEDPYEGVFYEKHAGRGEMKIVEKPSGSNVYEITIYWPSSAAEATQWTFSGEFNGRGLMEYDNCTRVDLEFDEDGNATSKEVYTGGKGELQRTDEGALWRDDHKDSGEEVEFIQN